MASEMITEAEPLPAAADMEVENPKTEEAEEASNGEDKSKRERDEAEEEAANGAPKKQKVDEEKSVEEERMEKLEEERETGADGEEQKEAEKSGPVSLGPKTFASAVEMFDYFYKLLHHWPTNVRVNKYEYMVLVDLIKKGHPEPEKKIGAGVKAIEIREDESVEDFSFRKSVDHILPLPENMKIKSDVNRALGGGGKKGGGGGGRGGGRGRGWGRGGKSRRCLS
ncbi:hypothetical protein Cgig2_006136 [Carnegiea gigantea]|uniref:Uncharacterized protein n=1 Tax=Carnegiea gigantea TaxID=171969 RepID=A0A9Q1L0U4_9CARY|nr:hypothetical protein Cgig2_006136 [Carnegiea gigantea]